MTVIAKPTRDKFIWATVFFVAAAFIIWTQPFWEDGGLKALVAGGNDGRGWWPLNAALSAAILLGLAWGWRRILKRPETPLILVDGRLEHPDWKTPLPAADICRVEFKPRNLLLHRSPRLFLELNDGTVRDIPTFMLKGTDEEIGRALCAALDFEPAPLR